MTPFIFRFFPRFAASSVILCSVLAGLLSPILAQDRPLVLAENMKVLGAELPNTDYRFMGSSAPGQMYFPEEKVTVNFDFAKGADQGTVTDFSIELQEISTRNPDSHTSGGFTDTSGYAPLIGLEGAPLQVPLTVSFTDQARAQFSVPDFPLPEKFGTYALILKRGDKRLFLGTLARLPQPRADGTVDNTPLFGEGALDCVQHPGFYARMGVRGWRIEASWSEREDGTVDWAQYDKQFDAAEKSGCQIMSTLSGAPVWARPFKDPTPAIGWTPTSGGYGGGGDWTLSPSLDSRYGAWLEAFARRYWKDGKGGLWGIENYNEPWEGGGISGWASDIPRYRTLQKLVATSIKKVDVKIPILAACSIMNTEDKFYSDGTNEMDPYVDIFTDHYVIPVSCYGPEVAKAHGKRSMETETWFVNSEYSLAQGATQILASGQSRVSAWHPRVLFDTLPGFQDSFVIPTPVVVATAAFNNMVTGRPFEKMVFQDHLPFAFQFGKDEDKDSVVLLFGRLMPIGNQNPKILIWSQVNGVPGGTIAIDNSDGTLEFYDVAGNREFVNEKTVTLPLSYLPTYIKSPQGPVAVAARLNQAKIEGKRFLEIVPHDFTTMPNTPGATVRVELRNRLNREITGNLKLTPPDGLTLAQTENTVTLKGGEIKTVEFPVTQAALSPVNAYPFKFDFSSADGAASYAESLNAAVAVHRTIKVDGDLADWAGIPAINVIGTGGNGDITEQLRRPWLEIQKENPHATSGEFKMAWDENYIYVCATVNDPTPEKHPFRFSERDENSYFHSADSDTVSPYKEFIEAFRAKTGDPKRSFAEVPYVYRKSPEEGIPFRRDRLQFAFDVTPGWHELQPATEVPMEFHAEPDTDYEYSLYWVDDNKNGSGELWRLLAPGVPRINNWPHEPHGKRTTGVVPEALVAVKRQGDTYIYEAAIPKSELADLKFQAGSEFGFAFQVGNSDGPNAVYGGDKAVTKLNGMTMHPYWESHPNADTRWTLLP